MQLTHYNTNFKQHEFPITLVCDNVTNAANIGSLFRIADAFGIEKLVLCGPNITLGRKVAKTSRATEKIVKFDKTESAIEVIKALKTDGHLIISLEITSQSQAIHTFQISQDKPIVLVIGDENFGVSESILKISDHVIHIDMYGRNSSMNVVQAANIALYELTKQLL
ncbi:TrmH family RNA methyltransferase [Algibacter mikhailovii]|uniref:RNA methyltransferase n=1 Tax=Algibacter mikhailovii TaxID=425498 RepID=A0A918V471_9FLAO|nr:TrmH family RNA methyltransferase [Algibacter mikhailovii]GGZ68064.1 RNA methyltransferase [Algibacter mikhailovii]